MGTRHSKREVPYPPVFKDWRDSDYRVATGHSGTGIEVQMTGNAGYTGQWRSVELTEEDACLLAASLLQRAGRVKLAARVLKRMDREGEV